MRPTLRRALLSLALAALLALLSVSTLAAAPVGTNDFPISDMGADGVAGSFPALPIVDLAYNPVADQYLVVWAGIDGADGISRIYGQLVDARTGAGAGANDFLIGENTGQPGTASQAPAVAYNSASDEFLVVWEGDDIPASLSAGSAYEIYAQRVDASGALIGGRFRVSDMGSNDNSTSYDAFDPDVTYNSVSDEYLVVWEGDDNTAPLVVNENEIFIQRLALSGATLAERGTNDQFISRMGVDADPVYRAADPAVAYNSVGDEYLVVWDGEDLVPGQSELYGQRISAAGAEVGADDFRLDNPLAGGDEVNDPALVYNPTANEYLALWQGEEGSGYFRLYAQRVAASGAELGGDTLITDNTGGSGENVFYPQAAYNPALDEYLVVWHGEDAAGFGLAVDEEEIFGRRYSPTLATVEGPFLLSDMGPAGDTTYAVQTPAVAYSEAAVNGYLAIWRGDDNTAPLVNDEYELFGQLVAPSTALQVTKTRTSAARPAPGDPVTYTVIYSNGGPDPLLGAVVSDLVPAALGGVVCTVNPGYTGSAPVLRGGTNCTFDIARLNSGQGGTITISAVVAGTVNGDGTVSGAPADGSVVVNTATIGATALYADSNSANNSASASLTVDYPPRLLSITRVGASPTNAGSVQFLATFSESVTGGASANFGVTATGVSGASVTGVSGSGATRTVTVSTGTGDGTIRLDLMGGASIADVSAGKALVGSYPVAGEVYTIDKTPPAVTVNQAAGQADPTNAGPITFEVEFSESVSGFTAADVSLGGTAPGTLSASVSGSGTSYTVTVSGMTGSGTVEATVPAGGASDAAGNTNTASTSADNSVIYDVAPPKVTVNQAAGQADPTNTGPITFEVEFSESVSGFTAADVSLGGTAPGTLSASVSGSGTSYTVAVSGMTGSGTVEATVPAGGASDAAGNTNAASTSADNSVTYDATPPTVTVNQAAGQTDPTNTGPITFEVEFSESVSGFTAADVSLGGTAPGTLSASVSGSGTSYTVAVSGMTGSGTVEATVPAGGASDAAGNGNTASTSADNSVTYDVNAPTVMSIARVDASPTNAASVQFLVTFSESVTGGAPGNFDLAAAGVSGASVTNVSGSGATRTVTVSTGMGDGTLGLDLVDSTGLSDGVGNPVDALPFAGELYKVDKTAPTVTMNQATGQADPTSASPVAFEVKFSESVSGFTAADVSLGGTAPGTLSASVSGSGTSYTVTVSGMTGSGTVEATAPAGGANDAAGNTNAASTSADNSVAYDVSLPAVVSIAMVDANPTNAASVQFLVTFSESVTGGAPGNFDLAAAGVSGASVTGVSGSGATRTVTVNTGTGDGTLGLDMVDSTGLADSAGNAVDGLPFAGEAYTVDKTAPALVLSSAAPDPTNTSPIPFTAQFDEVVSGFDLADIVVTNGAAGAFNAVDGDTYTFEVTPAGQGAVTVSVAAGAASDGAANPSAAADSARVYDSVPPAVSVAPAGTPGDPTGTAPVVFEATFSEPVSGFDQTDIDLSGGTAPGALVATVTGSGASYRVSVAGMTGAGTVMIAIPAAAASDAAGNPSAAAKGADLEIDFNPATPVVTGITPVDPSPSNAASVRFRVTFSEAVSGFDAGDLRLDAAGVSGAAIGGVSGSGTVYTVEVTTGAGSGRLGLNLVDDDSIGGVDSGIRVGGAGAGNGDFVGSSYEIDRIAPAAAALVLTAPARGAAGYTFAVTYTDNLAVAAASLGAGDVTVSGPGGFNGGVSLVSMTPAGDGTPRVATYSFAAPGGSWDSADNGAYTLTLAAGAVTDTAGNAAPATPLGGFTLALEPELRRVYLPLTKAAPAPPDLVVEAITTEGGRLAVVVRNVGGGAVTSPFWVDLYLNPNRAPAAVNEVWHSVGEHGAVWGVTAGALPLAPGERLTLTLGDGFYRPDLSRLPATIGAGSTLYAHADSANAATRYGAVLEGHEIAGGAYNNIITATTAAPVPVPTTTGPALTNADDGLPVRGR